MKDTPRDEKIAQSVEAEANTILFWDKIQRGSPPHTEECRCADCIGESFRINAEHAARLDALITPAGVTDHSSYELGITMERERCARIAETLYKDYGSDAEPVIRLVAEIRSGK